MLRRVVHSRGVAQLWAAAIAAVMCVLTLTSCGRAAGQSTSSTVATTSSPGPTQQAVAALSTAAAVGVNPAAPRGPAFPAGVAAGPSLHPRPDLALSCADNSTRRTGVLDPGPQFPRSVEEMARRSPVVAIVTAQEQHAYWKAPGPGDPSDPFVSLIPRTATNFTVETALKGQPAAVIQTDEDGAHPDALACSGAAYEWNDAHLPIVGHRYVLFLSADLGGGRYQPWFGSAGRFEVVDGLVHTEADYFPHDVVVEPMKPAALDQFTARVRAA